MLSLAIIFELHLVLDTIKLKCQKSFVNDDKKIS